MTSAGAIFRMPTLTGSSLVPLAWDCDEVESELPHAASAVTAANVASATGSLRCNAGTRGIGEVSQRVEGTSFVHFDARFRFFYIPTVARTRPSGGPRVEPDTVDLVQEIVSRCGANIRRLRVARDFSLSELARRSGV